jgi:hypothetical protein
MKFKCVDNTGYVGFLTIGKIYEGYLDKINVLHNLSNDRGGTKDVYYYWENLFTIYLREDNLYKIFI